MRELASQQGGVKKQTPADDRHDFPGGIWTREWHNHGTSKNPALQYTTVAVGQVLLLFGPTRTCTSGIDRDVASQH